MSMEDSSWLLHVRNLLRAMGDGDMAQVRGSIQSLQALVDMSIPLDDDARQFSEYLILEVWP